MPDLEDGECDAIVFLDANMPNMDKCSNYCSGIDRDLVLCKHRFAFVGSVLSHRKALVGLDDFRVLQYFFKLIEKNPDWQAETQKPLFILVTKDQDFLIKDVPESYARAVNAGQNQIDLTFLNGGVVSDGKNQIIIMAINCKNYGDTRIDNLRCMIKNLNDLWFKFQAF